jgi:hypothetical protein
MMLRYSLNQENLADKIEAAVNRVLDQGYRTQDIAGDGNSVVGTSEMGDLVVKVRSSSIIFCSKGKFHLFSSVLVLTQIGQVLVE